MVHGRMRSRHAARGMPHHVPAAVTLLLAQLCQPQWSRSPAAAAAAAAAAAEPGGDELAVASAMMAEPSAFLRALLQPHDPRDFLDTDWERRPRHLSRSPAVYGGLLDTGTGAVERLVQGCVSASASASAGESPRGGPLQAGLDVTFVKDGQQPTLPGHPNVGADQVSEGLGFGYSVVLNWVQYRSTAVAQLAEAFEASLGFRASVNMYHTPGRGGAFAPHYDWNDVFVLQLNGSKAWAVWEPVVALPRSDERRIEDEQLKAALGTPAMDLVLKPGDILYLPRGYPHAAKNLQQETSTHLTVAVHAYVYETVEGFLQRAAAQWISIAVPAAKRRSPLRKQLRVLEKRMSSPIASDASEAAGSVGLVALHAAVRAASMYNASLRETIVGPLSPLSYQDRFRGAAQHLCEATTAPSLGMAVEFASPARSGGGQWGPHATGLGSASEFAAELELARIGSGLTLSALLPHGDAQTPTPDADYAQGVFQGLKSLATWVAKELKETGTVTILTTEKDAFAGVWQNFCSHLSMESTWEDLVEWHKTVRGGSRQAGWERWDEELEAHRLPALRRMGSSHKES
jgi:hypothetical protein